MSDRLVVTQYRDPITSEARTVTTCEEHTARLLRVLRSAGVGCGSTFSPSFDCDACENERKAGAMKPYTPDDAARAAELDAREARPALATEWTNADLARSIYADEQVLGAIAKVVNEVPEAFVSRAHIADLTLRTVAPFVAAREAQAAAKALRDAAGLFNPVTGSPLSPGDVALRLHHVANRVEARQTGAQGR